ncbi:hypothetical protein BOX15_Mlig001553g5, partial [Macrostomum lignano]
SSETKIMSTETSGDAALAAQLAQMEMGGTAVAGQGSQQQPPAQQQQQQPPPAQQQQQQQQQQPPPAQQQQQQPPPAQQQQRQHNGLAPEHLTKLRADVNVVQKNATVFAEMLAEQEDPAVTPEADAQLLRELAGTNQQMQARMLELIGYLGAVIGGPSGGGSGSGSGGGSGGSDSPGQLLEDLLRLNDQLNDSLRRFDRLRRAWQDLASGGSFNPMFDLAETTAPPASQHPPPTHPPPASRPQASNPPPDFQSRPADAPVAAAAATAAPAAPAAAPAAATAAPAAATAQAGNPGGLPDSEKELAEMETWMGQGGGGLFPAGGSSDSPAVSGK